MDLVGKRIKVVLKNVHKWKCANACVEPDYYTYVGRYLPRPKWLSENEIMLTTGDYVAPVRIIDKTNVVKLQVDKSDRPDGVYLVDGDKRKYVVTSGPFGRFSCDCTAYNYRKRCNHIAEVKAGLKKAS